jgi:hypothetical protein
MKEIRCYGCGAIIQNENKKLIGYVPKKTINDEEILCQRCFKLRHYHQLNETNLTKDDYLKILQTIGDHDCLVVYIIDLFDFEGSQIQGLIRHVGGNDIYVLANKRDVLPKSLKEVKLEHYVRRQLKKEGIKPVDVKITSGLKKLNFDEIYENIEKYRKGRDVYVVGVTNVGKSTFINALLKHYASVNDESLITVSEFPGTTLDFISIPLDENTFLYDTPGIVNEHQMTHYVETEDLKTIIPASEMKPLTFQLNSDQSLYLSGLARIDYIEGEPISMTCYTSRYLQIHRTKTMNADGLYNRHKTLKIEVKDIKNIEDMKKYEFSVQDKCDIFIAGLGFIKISGKGGKVRVYAPKEVLVLKRESLI